MKNNKFMLGLLLGLTFFLYMGAFTRDWTESTPTDATVANQIDDYNRYLRVDASDRLKEMVYGFTAGENTGYPGIKELIFKQQSSAPGTTNADEITFYSIDDGSNCGLYAIQENGYTKQLLKKVGSDINFVIETADIPADVIDSVHLVDDFTFDTFPLSPSAAPDANYELANKKYVDDTAKTGADAMHDAEGGYSNCDINGTKTKIYTKYISGNLDADTDTSIAHGESVTRILSVFAACWDDTANQYRVYDHRSDLYADVHFVLTWDATNVIIKDVGSYLQGNGYKIRIDYIL